MSEKTNNNGGAGFCSLLTILFIGLKLGNVITWSWVWVLSPMWICLLLLIILLIIIGGIKILMEHLK